MEKRRVLFVDDEPNVIDGLRRMLRRLRTEWDMEFVSDAATALTRMATCPFDVVITDLKMPGMDGAELLERVMEHYPATARIVLSGHADETATRRALTAAHRFLAKPADADTLVATVADACAACQIVGDDRLRALVGGCDALPSAPSLYLELSRTVESETAGSRVIADIICRDMAMAAKILQLVNSSFFGIARRVSSVEQAVTLLGLIRIKALVLSEHVFQSFRPRDEIECLTIHRLWRHSLNVADLARAISRAEKQTDDRPDQAFMAGLLHDIGLLVLACCQSEALDRAVKTAMTEHVSLVSLEKEIVGATHAEVGAYLLRLWGLPPRIVEAVSLHHTPNEVAYDGLCALTAVHVGDILERTIMNQALDLERKLFAPELNMPYLERIGLTGRIPEWNKLAAGMTPVSPETTP